jgi:hypothetical protein
VVYREEEPVETRVDKENAVLSVGLLMNSIRFYRGIDIDFVFREDQGCPLKGGDRQLFHRAHLSRLLSGDNPDLLGRRNRYRCHGKTAQGLTTRRAVSRAAASLSAV